MSEIIVQKFGGTSVGSVERIGIVANIVAEASKTKKIIVVVSAMGGETNKLVKLANHFGENPDKREFDALVSTGETVSSALLAMALHSKGIKAKSYSASQISMRTTDSFSKAKILDVDADKILKVVDDNTIPIITGFQGITEGGDITTLGRGGSDTTAVAIAAQVGAKRCDIYTDVDGVYTTDPRVVLDARLLKTVTFEEMLELSSLGAKVLQIRSVEFAGKYRVPLRVLSSFEEGDGTLISFEGDKAMEEPSIAGIAFERDEAKLTVTGVPDVPGIAYNVIGPVSEAGIEVDVIVQNAAADGTNDITFTVKREESDRAKSILENISGSLQARAVHLDAKICKVSLVGVGMRSHAGIASKMFKALAQESINIQIITTSEIKISVVIEEKYLELAVRALHSAFELSDPDGQHSSS